MSEHRTITVHAIEQPKQEQRTLNVQVSEQPKQEPRIVTVRHETAPTREAEPVKLLLRLPAGLQAQIKTQAKREYRSLNGQIVHLLGIAMNSKEE